MKSLKIRKPRQEKTRGQTDEQPCGVRPAAGGLALSVTPHVCHLRQLPPFVVVLPSLNFPRLCSLEKSAGSRRQLVFFPFSFSSPSNKKKPSSACRFTLGAREHRRRALLLFFFFLFSFSLFFLSSFFCFQDSLFFSGQPSPSCIGWCGRGREAAGARRGTFEKEAAEQAASGSAAVALRANAP